MSAHWFNGAIGQGPIALDPRDRGLNLGDGLFETILAVNRMPLWANMHLARMQSAANELGIPFNRAAVDTGIAALLDRADDGHQVLRVTLTRGAGARGLAGTGAVPALLITCDAFDAGLMFQPAALLTSTIRRSPAIPGHAAQDAVLHRQHLCRPRGRGARHGRCAACSRPAIGWPAPPLPTSS